MKMFKCLSLVSLFLLVLSSCGDKTITDGTLIKGKVSMENYEGKNVYLEMTDGSMTIADSSLVENGSFSFTINDSVPSVYHLILKESSDDVFPIILPVVSEKGNISVMMGEYILTEGTPLNDKLQDFLIAKSQLSDKSIDEENYSLDKFKAEFADLIEKNINLNKGNAIAEYLLSNYGHNFSPEQLERIRTHSHDNN